MTIYPDINGHTSNRNAKGIQHETGKKRAQTESLAKPTFSLAQNFQKTEIRGIFSASSQQKHLVDAVNFLFVVAGYILRH
mmetsp:Transcript_19486/g.54311  ORF Transcript_19486/g.54311 Transcript_19486/m.54311 type:complete len:80 (-) Transcript_19486:1266-1505(-)